MMANRVRSAARGSLLASLGFVVASCASAGNIADSRGDGETRCYIAPYDILWPAAESGVRSLGLVLERANRENGIIVARTYKDEAQEPAEMVLGSHAGERVAVFLERDSLDGQGRAVWALEVVSRPIFALDVSARDWTRAVFLAIESRLPEDLYEPADDLAACSRVRGRPSDGS
ncbi:MAG: hypothetical protein ACC682_17425 [Gemmatimonadota bacterium]